MNEEIPLYKGPRRRGFGRGAGTSAKWPFIEFEVGQELLVPIEQADRARMAASYAQRATGYCFRTERINDGRAVRIWRVW